MDASPDEMAVEARFEILERNEVPYDEPDEGPRLTRVTIRKAYQGVIDGHGVCEVLTAQGAGGSGFVASERVVGSLAGRSGSFVIQHGGVADGSDLSTVGVVVPGSGTGELASLRGQATEAAEGFLSLRYTL